MKKYLYIALAAVTLASCSQDDTLDAIQGEAISFGEAFVDNATRAADPSYGAANSLTAFKVWGSVMSAEATPSAVAIFADDNVQGTVGTPDKTTGVNVWNCTTKTQYWIPGSKYNFAAVVNGNVTELDNNKLPKTITYTADGTSDLLYAKSIEYTGKSINNDLVEFDFAHLLSKAKFTVTNTTTSATMYKHEIVGIKISNAYANGSYDVETEKWIASATSPQEFGSITATAATTECEAEKLLIPGLISVKVEFTLNLYINDNGTYKLLSTTAYTGDNAKTATITGGLLSGHAYNFGLSVGMGEVIKFTVEQNPTWTDATGEPEITV